MRRIALVGVLIVLAAGCIEADPGRTTSATTIRDCEVTGYGSFATGETFSGTFSDILGAEAIDWLHDATGLSFEASTVGTDEVVCRQNGEDVGTVTGLGTATVNGIPNYTYRLQVADHRAATIFGSVALAADAATDGAASLSGGELVTIPAEIDVTAGDSTGAVLTLTLDAITCTYAEAGNTFTFSSCSDASLAPGDEVAASALGLRVDGGTCPADDDDDDDDGDDDDDDGHRGCGRGHDSHGHGRGLGHARHGDDDGCDCRRGRGHTEHGRGHGYGHDHHDDDCSCDDDGGGSCVPLAVAVDLTTAIVPPGDPDSYSISFAPADGSSPPYTFSGSVYEGDIDVQFL